MNAKAIRLLGAVLAMALVGCEGLQLGPVSPLAGTWYGAARSPGRNAFTGKVVFDYSGDMTKLDVSNVDEDILLLFDGQPHVDVDGNVYVARARTTIDGNVFAISGRVEYTKGKYEGVTYITLVGTVRYGSMDATLEVNFPNGESALFYLDASRR